MARRVVSKEEFVAYLRAHGPTETAKWEDEIRAQGGYVEPLLPPEEGELPAVDDAEEGALPAVGGPAEEDEAVGGLSLTPSAYLQEGRNLQREFEVARQQLAQQREAQYAAQQRIAEQRFAGPSRTEQLLALSNAFFQQPQYRGFAGMMANVVPALQQITQARRTAEEQRADALTRLQQQYQTSQAEDRASALANRLALYKAQGPVVSKLATPARARTGFNPVTGQLTDLDTGLPIKPPPPSVGEIRNGYRFMGGDPASQSSWQKVR